MMSERAILITGNGFDLAHGLKTNYMDFVHRVEEAFAKPLERRSEFDIRLTQLCNVNGFFRHFHFAMPDDETWNEFEEEMEVIVKALEHFLAVIAEEQKDIEFDPASFNVYGGTFTYADLQVYKHFARIFEQIYDDPSGGLFKIRQTYLTQYKLLNKKAFLDEVYRELETFTEALDLYFTVCAGTDCVKRQLPLFNAIAPEYVINFNYTDTAQIYGIPEDRIYYAKGRAGFAERAAALHPAAAHTNLVAGIPDKSDTRTDWLQMQNDFQRLMNFIGDIPLSWLEEADRGEEESAGTRLVTYWYGYSFPEGDAAEIRRLEEASAKMVIYYLDPKDFARKVLSLVKIFGKKPVTAAMQAGRFVFEQA